MSSPTVRLLSSTSLQRYKNALLKEIKSDVHSRRMSILKWMLLLSMLTKTPVGTLYPNQQTPSQYNPSQSVGTALVIMMLVTLNNSDDSKNLTPKLILDLL